MSKYLIDIHTFHDLSPHLEDTGCHLFIDIDNTLIEPVHHGVGSVQWEKHLVKEYLSQGMSQKKAELRASHLWKAIQNVVSVKLTEEEVPELLDQVRKRNIPITPVTARSEDVLEITLQQLDRLGLCFDKDKRHAILEINGVRVPLSHGILFCGGHNKGEVIKGYLKHIRSDAQKVILVDDTRHHILEAKEALAEINVKFVGLRYGLLDEKVNNYVPDPATDLWHKMFIHSKAREVLSKAFVD